MREDTDLIELLLSLSVVANDVCPYESKCGVIDNPIADSAREFVRQHRKIFLQEASRFEVHPIALAGVFIAEHSMNVRLDDQIQNLFSKVDV